jgi:hypothetical protein
MPGKYTGVHSFLFLYPEDDPEAVIRRLKELMDPENGPVFFADDFEGPFFRGFAHIAGGSPEELADVVDQLWDVGVRSDLDTETKVHKTASGTEMGPKRGSPRFCAICRVQTSQRPTTVLRNIADAFGEAPPFVGASTVVGRFKLVVELGDDDRQALEETHLESLRAVDGVVPEFEWGIADTETEQS